MGPGSLDRIRLIAKPFSHLPFLSVSQIRNLKSHLFHSLNGSEACVVGPCLALLICMMTVRHNSNFKLIYMVLGILGSLLVVTKFAHAQQFDSCVRYSLENSFASIGVGEKSPLFVRCSTSSSQPQAHQPRPKYSNYEIKNLSENYLAVMDCLEIDPTLLFPKLMAESGFHTLIQNPNGDAGIGQLTKKAIRDVDANLSFFKAKIIESTKPSCKKIKNFASSRREFWTPIAEKSKCAVMNRSLNPMKNLLYTAIFHKLNERYVGRELDNLKIGELLIQAGYPSDKFTEIKNLMITLGYNTGGAVAVRNLRDYLESRIDFINRKIQEYSQNQLMALTAQERIRLLGFIGPEHFNFAGSLDEFKKRKEIFRVQLALINPKMDKESLDKLVALKLRNESSSTFTFPEWLLVWQSHGGPGYLSSLARYAQRLDKQFGAGVCSNTAHYRVEEI